MVLDTKMEKSKPPCETSFQKKIISLKKAEVQSEDPASPLRIILPVRGRGQPCNAAQHSIRVTGNILSRQDQCKTRSLYDFTLVIIHYTQRNKRTKFILHMYICNVLNLVFPKMHSVCHT